MPKQLEIVEDEVEDVVAQEYVERFPIDDLKPHPSNPNEGDVGYIRNSIKVNGWYGAVTIQKSTNLIIVGEHRWRAAQQEGRSTVPVFIKDCDDAEALRIMLIDNEAARRARYKQEVLELTLANLAEMEGGLDGSGFDLDDLKTFEENRQLAEPGGGGDFTDQYGIIIECDSEKDQIEIFDRLTDLGFENLRVIAV